MKSQIKLPQNCHVVTALSFFPLFFNRFHFASLERAVSERMMYDEGEGGMGKICFMSKNKKYIKKTVHLNVDRTIG